MNRSVMAQETKEYRRMQNLLLILAACIAIDQTLLSVLVLAALLHGLYLAWQERKGKRRIRTWPKALKYILLLLLADGYASLHNPLVTHEAVVTFNFFYVVGQYTAVVWLFTRFGNLFAGRSDPFSGPPAGQGSSGGAGRSFWDIFRGQPFPLRVLRVLGWVALVVLAGGVLQHFFGGATDAIWVDKAANPLLKNRIFSTWENPNILAGYLCVVAAYVMSYISVVKESRRRWILFGILLVTLLCQVYTFSRGFWAAMAVEVVAFVFLFYRKGILYLLGVGAIGGALAGPVVWQRLATLKDITADSSAAMRLAYIEIAEAIVEDHPLGIGWYNYRYVFPEYDYYFKNPDVIMYHCHNLLLNFAAELGVQGAVLFVAAWIFFLVLAWKLHKSGRFLWMKAMGRGYLLMSLGIFVGGLGDHVFFNVRMGVLFWLLSTLLVLTRQYGLYDPGPAEAEKQEK